MTLATLARYIFWAGLVTLPIALVCSFTGIPTVGGALQPFLTAIIYTTVFVSLPATFLLWILDWVILVRTWKDNHPAIQVTTIMSLCFGIFFGPYLAYFLLHQDFAGTNLEASMRRSLT